MEENKIWIIGAGSMAREYAKVLDALGRDYTVIGRGEKSAADFYASTGHEVIAGGLEHVLERASSLPGHAIVAVNVETLSAATETLMRAGVKNILVEKPGFCSPSELERLMEAKSETGSQVYVAYNRRFYASVKAAEKIIEEDGGLRSMHFEFTEWSRSVTAIERPESVCRNWFYANSTHVVDLAFFIGGNPAAMTSYASGELGWHSPAVFSGAGSTDRGVLFSYCADWNAPGRWAVELMTAHRRIYLKPMESLQIQQLNSVRVDQYEIDDSLDKAFKPGLYLQTEAFINGDTSRLCSLDEQSEAVRNIYQRILNG